MHADSPRMTALWPVIWAACFAIGVTWGCGGDVPAFLLRPKLRGHTPRTRARVAGEHQTVNASVASSAGRPRPVARLRGSIALLEVHGQGATVLNAERSARDTIVTGTRYLRASRARDADRGVDGTAEADAVADGRRKLEASRWHQDALWPSADPEVYFLPEDYQEAALSEGDEVEVERHMPFALRWPYADPFVTDLHGALRGTNGGKAAGSRITSGFPFPLYM